MRGSTERWGSAQQKRHKTTSLLKRDSPADREHSFHSKETGVRVNSLPSLTSQAYTEKTTERWHITEKYEGQRRGKLLPVRDSGSITRSLLLLLVNVSLDMQGSSLTKRTQLF